MTPPFFITYANNSLVDHPELIKTILKESNGLISLDSFGSGLSDAYNMLADYYIETERQKRNHLSPWTNYLKFLADYKFQPPAQLEKLLEESESWFERYDDGLNSIEHDQREFQKVLDEISRGQEYDKITELKQLFNFAGLLDRISIDIQPLAIREKRDWQGDILFSMPAFLKSLSSLDLRKYLLEDKNFQRLKKCPICQKYFIAKDKKRKICYESECSKVYHKKDMQIRRDKNPAKYC